MYSITRPENKLTNKLSSNAPYSILRNPLLSLFDSFSVVLLSPFSNSSESPRDLLLWILAATDAAVVNPSGVNTILANSWSTFFINGKSTFRNDEKSLPSNLLD